jgi:hypothetical protein
MGNKVCDFNMYGTKSLRYCSHCCGTGTVGTVTFCLSGTGTGLHNGSGSGTRFESGFNIKGDEKVKKLKIEGPHSGI